MLTSNKISNNQFLKSYDLWIEISNSIANHKEMVIISPFIDSKQLNSLKLAVEKSISKKRFNLKILTTTFDGQMRYLDINGLKNFNEFINKNYPNINIQIKIEDARKDKKRRLHAKAYLFRDSKEKTSVVFNGSSNFTYIGMNTGEEWNLKIFNVNDPGICKEINDNFQKLWDSSGLYEVSENPEIFDLLDNYKKRLEIAKNESKENLKKIHNLVDSYPPPKDKMVKKYGRKFSTKNFQHQNKFGLKKGLYLQYALLNNSFLINNFIKIITNKKMTDDKVVNNLFLASFIAGELKITNPKNLQFFLESNGYLDLPSIVFKNEYEELLEGIKKLLKEKLKDTNLTDNYDLRNTILTYQQCKALSLHADYTDLKNWNLSRSSGIEYSKSKNSKIALFTDEHNPNSRYGYQDKYDRDLNNFTWYAPLRWGRIQKNKIYEEMKNFTKESLVFYRFERNAEKIYFEFLGEIKKIIGSKSLDNGQKIFYLEL